VSVTSTLEPAELREYNPFSDDVMADPHRFYKVLRDLDPVHYVAELDAYAISRFEDVWTVLQTGDGVFVASEGTLPPRDVLLNHNDGPVPDPPLSPLINHSNYSSPLYEDVRRAGAKMMRPRAVADMTDMIRRLANERLDVLLPHGEFDLTIDYGGVVSASVVCDLMDLPMLDAEAVLTTVNGASLAKKGVGVSTASAHGDYFSHLLPVVERRRAAGANGDVPTVDGLINFELQTPEGPRPLTDREVATQLLCIFIGGTETVPKVVAQGLWELAQRPEQLAAVRAGLPGSVGIAREEIIRYTAPAQWFVRTVRKPVRVGEGQFAKDLRPGQRVIALIASAAFDEREYPDPWEFRWDRSIQRMLAFGRGQHFCSGFHLARLEIDILIEEFLKRVPSYEILEQDAVRLPSSFQWGWNHIPVRVG
jgi:cytochrome P450